MAQHHDAGILTRDVLLFESGVVVLIGHLGIYRSNKSMWITIRGPRLGFDSPSDKCGASSALALFLAHSLSSPPKRTHIKPSLTTPKHTTNLHVR